MEEVKPGELKISRRRLLAALLLLPAGCAKSPAGGGTSPVTGPQLIVTLTVAGVINPAYYYFVLFNVNSAPGPGNTGLTGPVPVVAAPYGNGFAAGAFTNYVEYHGGQSNTNFFFYGISADLSTPQPLGSAAYLVNTQAGSNTLSFQLPLADLATATIPVSSITSLQINFIATNVVPVVGDTLTSKYVGALFAPGDTGNLNRFAGIPTGQSGIFNNTTPILVPTGGVIQYVNGIPLTVTSDQFPDVNDLSIAGFSVQVSS